jgi:hypothetical protein
MSDVTSSRDKGRKRPRGYARWTPRTSTSLVLDQVQEVLFDYDDYLPLSVRQIFYRLVASYDYPKTENAYANLCEYLVRARRARIIPFDSIRDDGIVVDGNDYYGSVADFMDAKQREARAYTRDRLEGQDCGIELWCEAVGMLNQLARTTAKYSVRVYSSGGFNSLTAIRAVVDRAVERPRNTVILHVGDYDPSGDSIFQAFAADAKAFFDIDKITLSQHIDVRRIALTPDQVAIYGLVTAPAKKSDGRSATWKGETCQLEALTPPELAEIVEDAIQDEIDFDTYQQQVRLEHADRIELRRALNPGPQPEGGS